MDGAAVRVGVAVGGKAVGVNVAVHVGGRVGRAFGVAVKN
jgi:hypothetical protein